MDPWLPSELWDEIEIRRFGDRLTWLGMKNRPMAVRQWALVMLHTPLSEEYKTLMRKVELCRLGLCGEIHEEFEEIRDLSDWEYEKASRRAARRGVM